jgi:hypothetical protein
METNTQTTSIEPRPRAPLTFVFAIVAVILVVAGAFYLYFQKSAIQAEQVRLDSDIASLQNEVTALEDQKVQAAQTSQGWMDQIRKEEVLWSGVITRVKSLIPMDAATQTPKIVILSYSGSQGGSIVLNAKTAEAQSVPWEYAAELLSVFNSSSYFADAYIPSLTSGGTDQGKKALSFSMNLSYIPEEVVDTPATSQAVTGTEADTKPKVSRE